jgi:hypothetical protein
MKAILSREMEDIASIEDKLGRSLTTKERDRIGVGNLRLYLEELLQKRYWCISNNVFFHSHIFLLNDTNVVSVTERYVESVPLIIPLLEKQHRNTTSKLREVSHELR